MGRELQLASSPVCSNIVFKMGPFVLRACANKGVVRDFMQEFIQVVKFSTSSLFYYYYVYKLPKSNGGGGGCYSWLHILIEFRISVIVTRLVGGNITSRAYHQSRTINISLLT